MGESSRNKTCDKCQQEIPNEEDTCGECANARAWEELSKERDQLLRDVRVLQDCHYKQHALRNCTENGGFEKTFSEYMAALDKAEQSGALTRWGGGGR